MNTYAMRTGLRVSAVCAVLLFTNLAASLSPISVNGAKLYDGDGKQFFVKGVIYAGNGEQDVLLDGKQCQIDAGLMKSLGVNTIRVYGADSTKDHKDCMEAFSSQGIYVWMDLATSSRRIPATKLGWTADLYNNFTSTVDHFAGYENLLAFTLGAEVLDNTNKGSLGAIAVKAAARDIRAFRDARGYRQIPVTYSSASAGPHLSLSGQFLACGDTKNRIEMFGIDSYSLCGDSFSIPTPFDRLYETFEHYNIPIVFTETGCVANGSNKRDFKEIQTMMSPLFQNKFSGAIVYEWAQQSSDFGLVEYSDSAQTGTPSMLDDYSALSTVFSTISLPVTPVLSYTATETAPACPTFNSASSWAIPGDVIPPTSISGIDIGTVTSRTTIISSSGSKSASQTGTDTRTNAEAGTGTGAVSEGSDQGEQQAALSGGALIGVIVGCVLAALLILAVAIFFFMRRRGSRDIQEIDHPRRASPDASEGLQVDPGDTLYSTTVVSSKGEDFTEKIELPANSIGRRTPLQELDATPQNLNLSKSDADVHHIAAMDRPAPSAIKGFAPAAKVSSLYEMPDTSLNLLGRARER
ncbi:unnamed protein product [Clonostachys rhizophaga]|uniref:1,3-beta-glucanosyltransferase n=1 Tax=Clonostachys rhizophaga TaxID=160324 RepID=A0A9N9YBL6_9HYPO|nr:unnamed protein product [Clonostachys rhizophaga]